MSHAALSVEQRLTALERSARRWRTLSLLATVAAGWCLLTGQNGPKQLGDVRVTRLAVVDADGKEAITLRTRDDKAPELVLNGTAGRDVRMLASGVEAVVAVGNKNSHGKISSQPGTSIVALEDPVSHARLGVDGDGTGFDMALGKPQFTLLVSKEGAAAKATKPPGRLLWGFTPETNAP